MSNLEEGLRETASEARCVVGSKAHVAFLAARWLKARELEAMHSQDTEALGIIAGAIGDTELLFWAACRLALTENAAVPK